MSPLEQIFERLVAANIRILPINPSPKHVVFERSGFVALVEKREDGFGEIGSAGMLVEKGFSSLIWRGGDPYFVAKGFEQPATVEQVDQLRAFQKDLQESLSS